MSAGIRMIAPVKPAIGFPGHGNGKPNRNGARRIVIAFSAETFARIQGRAEWEATSFAEQVRLLVEVGLMVIE